MEVPGPGIQATAAIYATAVAIPDPYPTVPGRVSNPASAVTGATTETISGSLTHCATVGTLRF